MQIKVHCLITNQMPALPDEQGASWGWAAMMLGQSLYFFRLCYMLHVTTYCNSFSQTEEVWINETCLKAKVKASAWKTIRKTQYSCYENYFQVFRGFSKKSYPEIYNDQVIVIIQKSKWANNNALKKHSLPHLIQLCLFLWNTFI